MRLALRNNVERSKHVNRRDTAVNTDDDMTTNVDLKKAGELINELHNVREQILTSEACRIELEGRLAIALGLRSAEEKEHRRHLRIPCLFPCRVVLDDQAEQGTVTDISLQGLYVETSMRVLAGERVIVELQTGNQLVCADVKSIWRRPYPPTGFGATFHGLGAKDEAHVHRTLTELLRQRLADLQACS
jgi:hypothetical protein